MKALIFLLVVVNLLFYAFSSGLVGSSDQAEVARLEQQVQPESIRIVGKGDQPPATKNDAVSPAGPEVVSPSESADAPPAASGEAPASQSETTVCLRWPVLGAVEAERVSRVVSRGFADFSLARESPVGDGQGWWVFIPPLGSKAAAEKKAAELIAFGVDEYFIIPDGANRFAISLGVFSTEKRGRERLAELQGKRVRSARLDVRPDRDGNIRITLRGPAAQREAVQKALAAALPNSPAQDCR